MLKVVSLSSQVDTDEETTLASQLRVRSCLACGTKRIYTPASASGCLYKSSESRGVHSNHCQGDEKHGSLAFSYHMPKSWRQSVPQKSCVFRRRKWTFSLSHSDLRQERNCSSFWMRHFSWSYFFMVLLVRHHFQTTTVGIAVT